MWAQSGPCMGIPEPLSPCGLMGIDGWSRGGWLTQLVDTSPSGVGIRGLGALEWLSREPVCRVWTRSGPPPPRPRGDGVPAASRKAPGEVVGPVTRLDGPVLRPLREPVPHLRRRGPCALFSCSHPRIRLRFKPRGRGGRYPGNTPTHPTHPPPFGGLSFIKEKHPLDHRAMQDAN